MKAQNIAIIAIVAVMSYAAGFTASFAFDVMNSSQQQVTKAPQMKRQKASMTVTFTEAEVPQVVIYRKSPTTKTIALR